MSGGVLYHAMHASWAVKWVMLLLLALSVVSWTMIIERYRYLKQVSHALWALKSQSEVDSMLHQTLRAEQVPVAIGRPLETILEAGQQHYHRSRHLGEEKVIKRCRVAMQVPQMAWEQALTERLAWLASIATISPYIGLLGTVLGIMMAFQALADAPNANMMVVAPGIAEALVTTALGLVVAIPANVAYNQLSSWAATLIEQMHMITDRFVIMVHDEQLGQDDASY